MSSKLYIFFFLFSNNTPGHRPTPASCINLGFLHTSSEVGAGTACPPASRVNLGLLHASSEVDAGTARPRTQASIEAFVERVISSLKALFHLRLQNASIQRSNASPERP